MANIINESYGRLEFHENYLVFTAKEGIDFAERETRNFICHVKDQYGDKRHAYISNRQNRYSINPLFTQQIVESTNVSSLAIVSTSSMGDIALEAETEFYDGIPLKIFRELDEAVTWSVEQLDSP